MGSSITAFSALPQCPRLCLFWNRCVSVTAVSVRHLHLHLPGSSNGLCRDFIVASLSSAHPPPGPGRHTQLPRSPGAAASVALPSGNLRGCGSPFPEVPAPEKISWPPTACPSGGSVKYRRYAPPLQLNPNKLKMSFLHDGDRTEWPWRGGLGKYAACGVTEKSEA